MQNAYHEVQIKQLQNKLTELAFQGKQHDLLDIAKSMIEQSYHFGRKQGHKEMRAETVETFSRLLPSIHEMF